MEKNIMEEEKITKLAFKLSVPMIISLLSMALYNIIDTVFISGISMEALNAVSLSFPVQVIISAFGLGLGIGVNSILAKTLGQKDEEKAKRVIKTGIILGIICSIFLAIVISNNIVLNKFFSIFTNKENIINLGKSYLGIISIFAIVNVGQSIFNKILEAHGKAKISMISQFFGIITNVILDPILIYGINGKLVFGIQGAAIATVIGRFFSLIYASAYIVKSKDIHVENILKIKVDKQTAKEIYKVALPTILLEAVAPVTTIVLNNILSNSSEDAVSVWGIYYKVQSVIFMVVSGLNCGMIPIVAYNYGAKRQDRIKSAIRLFSKLSFVVTAIGTAVFLILPEKLLYIFNANQNMIDIGVKSFRILSIGFIFASQCFIVSGMCQALGDGRNSLIIFLIRKVIIPFGIIYLLFKNLGLNSIWIGFTLAEIVAFIYSQIIYRMKLKKELN